MFYTAPADGPRPAALAQGAIVAALIMVGVFSLLGRGGQRTIGFSIGSRAPRAGLLGVRTGEGPAKLSTEIRLKTPREKPTRGYVFNYFQVLRVLSAIDTDHDLVISGEEMANAPKSLLALDQNHDGNLSPEECGFGSPARGPTADELYEEWMAFDRNGDGKLEKSELPERLRGLLNRAEHDADGKVAAADVRRLAEREGATRFGMGLDPALIARSRVWFMRVHPVLAALDTDANGEISPVEIATAAAALRAMDWNHDGELTPEELLPDPVINALAVYMVRWDTDADGLISKQEAAAMPKELRGVVAAADRDDDGAVSASELRNELRRRSIADADQGERQLEIAGRK
jgi:Ca2+-binding EF-hand superfamily protein